MIRSLQKTARRTDSRVEQIQLHVPRDVVEGLRGKHISIDFPAIGSTPAARITLKIGTTIKGSLKTRDPEVGYLRRLRVEEHLGRLYATARIGPTVLSQRDVEALAGDVYKLLIDEHGENPGTEAEWAAFKGLTRAAIEGRIPGAPPILPQGRSDDAILCEALFGVADGDALTGAIDGRPRDAASLALEQQVGRLTFWVLQRRQILVDDATYLILLRRVARAALDAGLALKKRAGGDYRPDPNAERFPSYEPKKAAGLTVTGLFDRWKAEVKPAPSTVSTWRGVVRSLEGHLGRDIEVRKLAKADVLAWKDALVVRGVQPRTINDQFLAALKALLNYGVSNGIVSENVAQGVRLQVKTRAGERMLPYTDDDVARLLEHAGRENAPAKRWLPWLAVLTGARIGELAQMWGSQVRQVDGIWALEIRPSPDGGTLKNAASERTVPLHPALIEAGFVRFAQDRGDRPLFYLKPARRGAEAKHPSKGTSNHLATWIRSLPGFDDERKAPSHAARHWFKTTGARLEIMDSLVNAIQGHTDATTAGTYRHFSIEQMARAVRRYPVPTLTKGESDGAMPAEIAPKTATVTKAAEPTEGLRLSDRRGPA